MVLWGFFSIATSRMEEGGKADVEVEIEAVANHSVKVIYENMENLLVALPLKILSLPLKHPFSSTILQ